VDSMLEVRVGDLMVRDLLGNRATWFAPGGRVTEWAAELCRSGATPHPTGLTESARLMVLAGVRAYRSAPEQAGVLHERLVRALASAGPDGVLAAGDGWDCAPEQIACQVADRVLRYVRETS
jgi:hypothetical protein